MYANSLGKMAFAALLALPTATVVTTLIPTSLAAEKGGNGNRGNSGSGRDNRDNADRNDRGNSNRSDRTARERTNNGRGAIASELKGLNAAHASQSGLENASPDSMTGKLYVYQQNRLAIANGEAAVTETGDLFRALSQMTEERFDELNPDLDYAETLAKAEQDYLDAQQRLATAQNDSVASLEVLTGGRELSDAAMEELHALLGL